ncbi:hypothetical protein [Nonomuraea endophytica]|uniref:UDP-N-acetylmuramyl pentapeptide phosphotransferase/UDP-N-acetylglucosamine-1-phosphate transferase n=1 Tax=Nonomuraea endophytica TaxID=714136 RepID=A0A7W8ADY3_9ACTN|nr:hypothetical protein [Nonomuraea endophytica]MBB5084268.1 UDP-N-acetylmuramyl pentapeptide phosphotransferase/UDP-N-acetylglucosamine-1-phosphate transferase [Nonomuraea endophytica]
MARALLCALAGAALGAVAARAAYSAFTSRVAEAPEKTATPSGEVVAAGGLGAAATWTRSNHRGEPITLLEGPAFVAGAGAAAALAPGLDPRVRLAALLAGAGSGALGAYDDLYGSTSSKGFKGHLSALAKGEVTSGAVKILGIGATGLAAAALVSRGPLDTLANGATIAGAANLANLFDLRPGRAIKVALLTGGPLLAASLLRGSPAGAALAAVPLGAAAALLPDDLGERAMLGDAGANALGALLGLAAVTTLGRPGRLAVLGTVAVLTAASEKVSFTKVIAGNPVLHRIDMLGRRPAP